MRRKREELESGATSVKLLVNVSLTPEEKEKILFENYSKYPQKQMHVLVIGLIHLLKKEEITAVEFLMTASYLLSNVYIKDLAGTYVVNYDSRRPHAVSKQYVHREIVTKILPQAAAAGWELTKDEDFGELNARGPSQLREGAIWALQSGGYLLPNGMQIVDISS